MDRGVLPGLSWGVDADVSKHEASYEFTAVNNNDTPIRITGLGRSGSGLELVTVNPMPFEIAAHASAPIKATFRVDCGKVSTRQWPFPITYQTGGKSSTQYLELSGSTADSPWQLALSDAVCHPQGP